MAVVPILQAPHVKLNTRCSEIDEIDSDIHATIQNLRDTLASAVNPLGAGLAAPQIGVTKRVCIVRDFNDEQSDTNFTEHVFINPVITKTSKETNTWWEGCLSIEDTWGLVTRPAKIKVEYTSIKGESIKTSMGGYFARLIQHEVDHLDGILFTSKVEGKTYTERELDALLKHEPSEAL